MAKGRKLTTSLSEQYLGSYSYSHGQGTIDVPELEEDDVWSVVDGMVNGDDQLVNGSYVDWSSRATSESNRSIGSIRSGRRTSRDEYCQVGGLSLAFDDLGQTASSRIVHQFGGQDSTAASSRGRHIATSAPVNVSNWNQINRIDSVESLQDSDDGDVKIVPPHEYLARSRRTAANSVFEGVGRTLKGRDMSRVRDAVWSQTGFNG